MLNINKQIVQIVVVLVSLLLLSCSSKSELMVENPEDTSTTPTYRLSTQFQGTERVLTVVDNTLRLRAVDNTAQQEWIFTPVQGGRFSISNKALGPTLSIDVVNDGVLDSIRMSPTGVFSGQYWTFTLLGNTYCRMHNSFTGDEIMLDIRGDGNQDVPRLVPKGEFSGQYWWFEPMQENVEHNEIIALCLAK